MRAVQNLVLNSLRKGTMSVFHISPGHFPSGVMMERDIMEEIFKQLDAFWMYDGNPCSEKPHALLKSGKHSNGFIMCKEVLQYPSLCNIFAREMVKKLSHITVAAGTDMRIDAVASSAYSALDLGHEVASTLARRNPEVKHIQVEKDSNGNPTVVRGGIDPDHSVLIVNELMTTGEGSTYETLKAIRDCNGEGKPGPKIINPAVVLVHRSKDLKLADGTDVVPVFHFDIENFDPDNCPYCAAGSEAIKPKVGDGTNWRRLHGRI